MTQANLACALGVPQQTIQIRNITLYANRTRTNVPFDPMIPQLNSGTDVVCIKPNGTAGTAAAGAAGAAAAPALRRMQTTQTLEISYDILNPPVILLIMNADTFTQTIANNSVMNDLVSALSGTGFDAVAPTELTTGFSTAPPPADTNASQQQPGPALLYGAIGAAIAAVVMTLGVAAFVVVRMTSRMNAIAAAAAKQPNTSNNEPSRVIYIVENNPLAVAPAGSDLHEGGSGKSNFQPLGVRR
jgi:hypothetical protein